MKLISLKELAKVVGDWFKEKDEEPWNLRGLFTGNACHHGNELKYCRDPECIARYVMTQ